MKTNKKGISLIVLVITIIVIIILAAAVILTLNNNNPIQNSKQATFDNDVAEITSAVNIYIANFMAKNPVHDGPFDTSASGQDWVTVGTATKEAQEAAGVNGTTTYGTGVTWAKLGINQPASIKLIEFNPKNGLVRVIPSQTGVNGTVKTPAAGDAPAVYYTVVDTAF